MVGSQGLGRWSGCSRRLRRGVEECGACVSGVGGAWCREVWAWCCVAGVRRGVAECWGVCCRRRVGEVGVGVASVGIGVSSSRGWGVWSSRVWGVVLLVQECGGGVFVLLLLLL